MALLDLTTNTVTDTISGFSQPFAVAIAKDGALAYVSSSGDGTVRAISTSTNTITGTYSGLNVPYRLAITPDDLSVYVANNGNNTISILPGLVGVYPNQGPTGGGTPVTLIGTHLGQATAVLFGTKPATHVTVLSDNAVTAVSPPARASSTSP